MFYGRKKELDDLKRIFDSEGGSLAVIYGRYGMGKTTLVKNFIRGKKCIYMNVLPAEPGVMARKLKEEVFEKIEDSTQVVVIDEFQNTLQNIEYIFSTIGEIIDSGRKIMFILTSSSIYWVENSMVSVLLSKVNMITELMKLKEISFVETAKYYQNYSIDDCLKLYAITGGIPSYIERFDETKTIKQNICNLFLAPNAIFRNVGTDIISQDIRETGTYNSILWCLATGRNRLNDLYEYLHLGRDKISVYLKNLMDREIVEKVYSLEAGKKSETVKGMYRISVPMVEFWYRHVYDRSSELEMLEDVTFYDKYIANDLKDMLKEAIIKVANEYIDFLDELNALPLKIMSKGRFWGKSGDINIVAQDEDDNCIVAQCLYAQRQMSYDTYEELQSRLEVAKLEPMAIYLFSASGFDLKLKHAAEKDNSIMLININEM